MWPGLRTASRVVIYGGHAGVEDGCGYGARLESEILVLNDFGVRVVESRIDEVGTFARSKLSAAAHNIKRPFGSFGIGEYVCRTAENCWACRSDRKLRVKAKSQDVGIRSQLGWVFFVRHLSTFANRV